MGTEIRTEEANKALVRSFLKFWRERDFMSMSKYWSPQMVHHARDRNYGTNEVFQLIAGFTEAFPDLEFEVEEILADGDLVSTRLKATATHKRDFMGIAATGKQITCSAMGMVRIVDGKIVEHWSVMDEIHLMQQLGLVPEEFLSVMASS